MIHPLSSDTRGAKGPSSAYWELMASATHESTTKVPNAFVRSTLAKSYKARRSVSKHYYREEGGAHLNAVLEFVTPFSARCSRCTVHSAKKRSLWNKLEGLAASSFHRLLIINTGLNIKCPFGMVCLDLGCSLFGRQEVKHLIVIQSDFAEPILSNLLQRCPLWQGYDVPPYLQ